VWLEKIIFEKINIMSILKYNICENSDNRANQRDLAFAEMFMKESNITVVNATIRQHRKAPLQNMLSPSTMEMITKDCIWNPTLIRSNSIVTSVKRWSLPTCAIGS